MSTFKEASCQHCGQRSDVTNMSRWQAAWITKSIDGFLCRGCGSGNVFVVTKDIPKDREKYERPSIFCEKCKKVCEVELCVYGYACKTCRSGSVRVVTEEIGGGT